MSETFYFVAYVDKGETLTVIDLAHCVDYERDEWSVVNDENFHDHLEAIAYARALAAQEGLKYRPFDSRYDSSLNEKLHLTLR